MTKNKFLFPLVKCMIFTVSESSSSLIKNSPKYTGSKYANILSTQISPLTEKLNFSAPLAVIDLETTGLDSRVDRIIEIGIIFLDTQLKIQEEFSTFINPQRSIDATFIHGITAQDVINAPIFSEISENLASLLAGRIIVAHNASFDISFLNQEFLRAGTNFQIPTSASICTLQQSWIYCEPGPHSLIKLIERLNLKVKPCHRALADAAASLMLLTLYTERELKNNRFTNLAFNHQGNKIMPNKYIVQACIPKLF